MEGRAQLQPQSSGIGGLNMGMQENHELQRLLDVRALEDALYREARLLDEERFTDWLEQTTEDVVYRMALTSRRFRKDRAAPLTLGSGYSFNDTRDRLALRIKRLQSGYVWAEDPPNFVRRVVSNVEISPTSVPAEMTVHSVIMIHRNRIDSQTRLLVAGREDCWRKGEGQWFLAKREIRLDHNTVPDTNLNVFF
ncbi:3-phenylpropionate/cinnamic acid dioxygenase subunit beta [Polycyclovorans algicola]|uniref:3-phenylpropionate/cinnamic acid dioxygenase subunit beta n=1 Tax=Polycyclovorans algicola TaxID=616992 RepID=UPI00190F307F|nr:3-phenylpropionate/cinnamic acid dioxygenase subunit beta [Polycyclovorans algicola]